jgi:hypothetical protein
LISGEDLSTSAFRLALFAAKLVALRESLLAMGGIRTKGNTMNVPVLAHQTRPGRPSKLSVEVVERLIAALERGSYIKPACEAAGISYPSLRTWIERGEADKAAGRRTQYSDLLDQLTRARAEGEVRLVAKLEADPDWRAGAFLLERGYRERWGKDKEETQPSVTIYVSAETASAIVDSLRVATATTAQPLIDVTAGENDDSASQ